MLAAVSVVMVISKKPKPSVEEVHYHAGFKVFVDGQLQDYSGSKFMYIKPCTADNSKEIKDEQMEKAHLHDGVGDVVHVEHQGSIWRDLFKNINVSFDSEKPLHAFTNSGDKIADILIQPIEPDQSIVIVVGDEIDSQTITKNAVTPEHIKTTGEKSETC